MINVLFVCMGNICRSPTAQGAFTRMIEQQGLRDHVASDSAGTHAYHVGEPPDPRAQRVALNRSIDISSLSARHVVVEDFEDFDYVLAMDRHNYDHLQAMCPAEHAHKLYLLLSFAPELRIEEVPDPYYGGPNGFERVMDLIETACAGLIHQIRTEHHL